MIRYHLICVRKHRFEGWFASSDAFETQRERGLLSCPHCGSSDVDRALMAPAVHASSANTPSVVPVEGEVMPPEPAKGPANEVALGGVDADVLRQAAAALREALREQATDVGEDFPEEARRIHYGEADERAIYGNATPGEARELVDEGIEILPLPAQLMRGN